jgi:uncharacterized protein (TIGR03437 family)
MTRFIMLAAIAVCAWGQPTVTVFNAASFQPGVPSAGALATAYVTGFSGLIPGVYTAPLTQPLPTFLGGVVVSVNDASAPLLAVIVPSDGSQPVQVNFQVPPERDASNSTYLYFFPSAGASALYIGYLVVAAQTTGPNAAALSGLGTPPAWGGFFATTNGFASAIHASDSSPVTTQNPAHPGETIIAYGDDFFTTWPPPPIAVWPDPDIITTYQPNNLSGDTHLYLQTYPQTTGCPLPFPNPPTCTHSVTNTPALQTPFIGLAAYEVGVEEIRFVVPANQQPGNWALFFNNGSCPDGSGVPGTCNANPASGSSSPYVLLPVD